MLTCNVYWFYYKVLYNWHLISSARVVSCASHKTAVSVSQVTGCLPAPFNHFCSISRLICSASLQCFFSIACTCAPVPSLRRKTPNCVYLVPILWGMLIKPFLPGNLSIFSKLGGVSDQRYEVMQLLQMYVVQDCKWGTHTDCMHNNWTSY